jgi:hypothetical protein
MTMSLRVLATAAVVPDRPPCCVSVPCFSGGDATHEVAVVTRDLQTHPGLPRAWARKIDRFSALAILAVGELIDALPQAYHADRVGLFTGNALGGWGYGEAQLANLVRSGSKAVHPHQATAWFPAAAQGQVTIRFQLSGYSKTTSGGALCGCEALLLASDALDKGEVDYAIAGAVESPLSSLALWGLAGGCPSALYRYGEGAAFLLLTKDGPGEGPLLEIATVPPADEDASPVAPAWTTEASESSPVRIPGVDAVTSIIDAVKHATEATTLVMRAPAGHGFAIAVHPSEVFECQR